MQHGVVRAGARAGGSAEDVDMSQHQETLERYARLAKAMSRNRDRGSDRLDNPHIPAGHTYFGQFVAHDLAFHETRSETVTRGGGAPIGDRTPRLDLDSLYGDGPEVDPHRFRREERSDARWRFALAPALARRFIAVREVGAGPAGRVHQIFPPSTPEADLPRRARCPAWRTVDRDGALIEPAGEGGEALIADPRNDENLLITQITILWMKLHNLIAERITSGIAGEIGAEQANGVYHRARKITVRCYQNVILHDFLRRLLHPDVYRDLAATDRGGPAFHMYVRDRAGVLRDRVSGERFDVPPEFWAAAFRIGHVMIQARYRVNDVFGNRPSSLMKFIELAGPDSDETPVKDDWIIDMGRFFFRTGLGDEPNEVADGVLTTGAPDREANFSHRLTLSTAREVGPEGGVSPTAGGEKGLIHSDLLRGLGARLGAPPMRNAHELFEDFPRIAPRAARLEEADIYAALSAVGRKPEHRLTSAEAAALADPRETPLLVYLLAEAQSAQGGDNGRHLGPLGSRIIGEVIMAAMTTGRDWRAAGLAADRDWRTLFSGDAPRSMPDVLDALG